jgi:hypothetical protein
MAFADKLKRLVEKGAAKTQELASAGKLKFEIAALNSKITDKKILLGDKAYALIKEGKISDAELKTIAGEIDNMQNQIKDKQAEYEKNK